MTPKHSFHPLSLTQDGRSGEKPSAWLHHGYIRRRQRGREPFGFHYRWGHMEFFSHQGFMNWGRFHFTKGNRGIFGRGNVAVHWIPTLSASLLTQPYVQEANQLFLCILMLSKSFQDPAPQAPRSLQGFLCLAFISDRLLWKIGKLDKSTLSSSSRDCLFPHYQGKCNVK